MTCPRLHMMGGRVMVRYNRSLFPGRCFVHMGCCRVKTTCHRSLREGKGRTGVTWGTIPHRGLQGSCPLTTHLLCHPSPSPVAQVALPPAAPAKERLCPRRGCATAGGGGHSDSPRHWAGLPGFPLRIPRAPESTHTEGPTHTDTPASRKPL